MFKITIINEIIKTEGGYVNDPSDSGGETNHGITKTTARMYGYQGQMKDLTKQQAFDIYSVTFWDELKLDDIMFISEAVAEEIADTGVNMGVSRAAKFLQRSLTSLNYNNKYTSLVIDGQIGEKTINSLTLFVKHRGENGKEVLVNMLNCLQGEFYINLTERRKKDKKFLFGWFKNRVKIK